MVRLCTAVGPVDQKSQSLHYEEDLLHAVSLDDEGKPMPKAICGLPYRPETLDLAAHWEEQHRPYLGAGQFKLHDQCVNLARQTGG